MDHARPGRSSWRGPVVCVLVVGALAVGAYFAGVASSGSSAASSGDTAVSVPQSDGPLQAAVPRSDPVTSAIAWLRASRELSYRDPSPTEWIDRALPVVTGELQRQYQQARTGSAGADWHDFVAGRCRTTVEGPAGVIPAEAPRTASVVSVQVTGNLRTNCDVQSAAVPPIESVAATIELTQAKDGLWRVRQRLY